MDISLTQGAGQPPADAISAPQSGQPVAVPKDPIPPEIANAAKVYFGMGSKVQILMISLGLVAFVASLVVATFGGLFIDQRVTKSVAFIAALSTGMLTLFNMSKKNQDIWAAWRMLNAAILRYQYESGYTYKDLIDTWEKAEKTLGNATINEK